MSNTSQATFAQPNPILTGVGLQFSYDAQIVLKNVNLSIDRGMLIGVIGPNGSGKTTLIRLLAGMLKPSAGRVILDGQLIESFSTRSVARRIAVVAQEESADFRFSVREEVTLGRFPHHGGLHFEDDEDAKIVAEAMEKTEVSHLADRMVDELSGGERQRVRVARALAQEPFVLLMDEPTNHLDLYSQLALMDLLRTINRDGIAVLLVSHDINFVCRVCSEIHILHNGVFQYSGYPKDVITEQTIAETFHIYAYVTTNSTDGQTIVIPLDRLT